MSSKICESDTAPWSYHFNYVNADGPSNEHLALGPSNLITNGSQSFSLTCNATNVYPTPDYLWSGITCDNGTADNVCVFTPDPTTDDLNNVTCTAVGSYGGGIYWPTPLQASKTIQLNVSCEFSLWRIRYDVIIIMLRCSVVCNQIPFLVFIWDKYMIRLVQMRYCLCVNCHTNTL